MKLKIIIAVCAVTLAVLFVYSQTENKPFSPAEDFPRGALLYIQVADLPAMIHLWNESKLKGNYLNSQNFADFSNSHLGRKLASRWSEFNDATGFNIDLETVGSLAANRASFAVYDVGKLEFVFIAPLSDELFAATKFAQSGEKFSEETLGDGTIIYRASVEADRGQQKQELIFAQIKGRFVLATSEKLLVQTSNNINGAATKNRLSDESLFKNIGEKIQPHQATVWLNQTALNDDYYFKRYWLMSEISELKNIRAGMFDFEIQENKIIEHRKFLLDKAIQAQPISEDQIKKLTSILPTDIPFNRLETAQPEKINQAIEKTIFFRQKFSEKVKRDYSTAYFSTDDYNYSSGDYWNLSSDFDEKIDDTNDEETVEEKNVEVDFSKIMRAANPRAILTFGEPEPEDAPLFANFDQAAAFYLASEKSFDRNDFETAILQKFTAQMMIGKVNSEVKWKTKSEDNLVWRELNFPMLNLNVSYLIRDNLLIISNDSEFLKSIATTEKDVGKDEEISSVNALTTINLDERENSYDQIFDEISDQNLDESFFTKNIQSLLESFSDVKKIQIREYYEQNFFGEEIIFSLK